MSLALLANLSLLRALPLVFFHSSSLVVVLLVGKRFVAWPVVCPSCFAASFLARFGAFPLPYLGLMVFSYTIS